MMLSDFPRKNVPDKTISKMRVFEIRRLLFKTDQVGRYFISLNSQVAVATRISTITVINRQIIRTIDDRWSLSIAFCFRFLLFIHHDQPTKCYFLTMNT